MMAARLSAVTAILAIGSSLLYLSDPASPPAVTGSSGVATVGLPPYVAAPLTATPPAMPVATMPPPSEAPLFVAAPSQRDPAPGSADASRISEPATRAGAITVKPRQPPRPPAPTSGRRPSEAEAALAEFRQPAPREQPAARVQW
jgi:hypothetical protein